MILAGQVIEGACVSFTVTLKVQSGAKDEVQVTVVSPFGKKEPDAGEQTLGAHAPLVAGRE